MSRRSAHSILLALAFVAAGLLAFAPSISRLLMPSAPAGWVALCSATGMKWLRVDAGSGLQLDVITAAAHGAGTADGHGDECGYCPLLASLATIVTLLALALMQHRHALLPAPRYSAHRQHRHPSGLGSRGPPRAFRIAI